MSRGRGGLPGLAIAVRPSRPGAGELSRGPLRCPARRGDWGAWKAAPSLPPPARGFFFLFVMMITTTAATTSPASASPRCLVAGGRRCRTQGAGCPCPPLPARVPGRAGGLGCWTLSLSALKTLVSCRVGDILVMKNLCVFF